MLGCMFSIKYQTGGFNYRSLLLPRLKKDIIHKVYSNKITFFNVITR